MREDGAHDPAPVEAPRRCGVGLRAAHIAAAEGRRPPVPFLEVHAENHMTGRSFATLAGLRRDNAISLHGVGLSLGGRDRPDPEHLARFAQMVRRIEPVLVSEHLSWCRDGDIYLNDLLPVRYDAGGLADVARNVSIAQDAIGRTLLLENPSRYLAFRGDEIPEPDFIAELCRLTGCRVLLDVNNVFVSARNLVFDPGAWLAALPAHLVGQMHLAGHEDDGGVLIDTHGAPVDQGVWALYAAAVRRFGPQPTVIERDQDLPPLEDLVAEARRADAIAAAAELRHAA